MQRAFLSLGSNMGDRERFLNEAIAQLPDVVKRSSIYETEPVGVTGDQNDFLNCVVEIAWDGTPHELLDVCQELEKAAGRIRDEQNLPRTLDIDILLIGSVNLHDARLNIPHPRMYERRFVMEPLAEIAPEVLPDNWEDYVEGKVALLYSEG